MKKAKKQNQYRQDGCDYRIAQHFFVIPEVSAMFNALAVESRGGRKQDILEALVRRTAAASPEEKQRLFQEAWEINRKNAADRLDARLAKALASLRETSAA